MDSYSTEIDTKSLDLRQLFQHAKDMPNFRIPLPLQMFGINFGCYVGFNRN